LVFAFSGASFHGAEAAAYTHYYAAAIAVIGYALLLCYILK
jgi:hypothetical protein